MYVLTIFVKRAALGLLLTSICLPPCACDKYKARRAERANNQTQTASSPPAAATPAPTPAPTPCPHPAPRMAEGSFNPNVPAELKKKLGDKPEAVVAGSPWRERYRPLLAAALTHSNPSVFYVYPFLDRTPCGVGYNCTYGGHLAGMAALAAWTDARLTGTGHPRDYGIPLVGPEGDFKLPSPEEWVERALADPDAAKADVILTGFYEALDGQGQYDSEDPLVAGPGRPALHVVMIERAKSPDQRVTEIYVDEQAKAFTFEELSAQQRRAMRAVADRLIAAGKLAARQGPDRGGLDLDTELLEVARLLDTSDSWGLMEGIDRALQLSVLFPEDTAPLQAASYGLNIVAWGYFDYGIQDVEMAVYSLRAYALSQVALAMNPRPDLSQINWMVSCLALGHKPYLRLESFHGKDTTEENADLFAYRQYVLGAYEPVLTDEQLAIMPEWMMLRQEQRLTWYFGHSGPRMRSIFEARLPHWQDCDLYAEQQRRAINMSTYSGNKYNALDQDVVSARLDMRMTMGSEVAALLSLAPDPAFKAQMLLDMGGDAVTTAVATALPEAAGLKPDGPGVYHFAPWVQSVASAGNAMGSGTPFYDLRRAYLNYTANWPDPLNPNHPAFQLLALLKRASERLCGLPGSWEAPSGYRGFEFTPAERAGFYHYRDCLFPDSVFTYWTYSKSVIEGMDALGEAVEKLYPDHHAFLFNYASGFMNHRDERKDVDMAGLASKYYRKAYCAFPLSDDLMLKWLRNRFFFHDRMEAGANALMQYIRQDPFDVSRDENLSGLAYRYDYKKLALQYYERYLKVVPTQYMLRNDWAYTMCQVGLADDLRVAAAYTEAPLKLTGNDQLWKDAINYFVLWKKDYDAARNYAEQFRKYRKDTNDPIYTQAWVEYKAGNMEHAIFYANQLQPGNKRSLDLAGFEANWGELLLDYGRVDLAEPHILKANAVDDYMGNSIWAMARLHRAKSEYAQAMKCYDKYLDRYGEDKGLRAEIALTRKEMGEWDKAVAEMEKVIFNVNPQEVSNDSIIDLLKMYEHTGEHDKACKAMAIMLDSGGKDRLDVIEALDVFEKIDATMAGKIRARLNEIMAGPGRFDQKLDWRALCGI